MTIGRNALKVPQDAARCSSAGPAVIGGLSRATNLSFAFGSVAILLTGVAITAAPVLRRTAPIRAAPPARAPA